MTEQPRLARPAPTVAPLRPDSRWIRPLRPLPAARLRLVCLPHAGGTAGYFRDWADLLPPDVELWAVQYPGRENRIAEPFVDRMAPLADHVARELAPFPDPPLVLFGHSMGAVLAHEVARRLTAAAGPRAVHHLVVSGCAAPHLVRPLAGQEGAHLLPDDDLVAVLRRLDPDGTALLEDPDMRSVLLPAVRNDYELIQSYRGSPHPPLRAGITAFAGRQDDAVDDDALDAWAQATRGRFDRRSFPGGHFYLSHHRDEVVSALGDVLRALR
ncbi:thioesterase II family protein [Streptantibioticus silvisoli]|uniref:Alpha/beta fold hydrolase n=1 Tax=Streptantibioticus silvisoli TaxID=2705255 RepID=A0ABT6W2N2_9ACTN|nr:alpha/beta fold hydrolase [Streptantibioticus silvisoli]MDI5965003.1 alpha/beta fold hydrolase [Streptantibioticus silvisoli]